MFNDPVVGQLCDNLLTTSGVPVADFTYYIRVLSDCDGNGRDDAIDIADAYAMMHPIDQDFDGYIDICETGLGFCDPDVNQDGSADQADIDYITNVVAGGGNPTGIDPDNNHDGNIDQNDANALINSLAGGGCP